MPDYQPDPAVVQFFEMWVGPIVEKFLHDPAYFPAIREKRAENEAMIVSRYGQCWSGRLSDAWPTSEPGYGRLIVFGCQLDEGKPVIAIFVRSLALLCNDFQGDSEGWESCIIGGLMHELDHLALGLVGSTNNLAENLGHETQTWARTCENTLRILTETYCRRLDRSDQLFHDQWVRCGRKAESQQWQDFIKKIYGDMRRA